MYFLDKLSVEFDKNNHLQTSNHKILLSKQFLINSSLKSEEY